MDDYIEEYKYNNCFWKKSGVLYSHSDNKFTEYLSIGKIFKKMSKKIFELSDYFGELDKEYIKPKDEPNYTREEGIEAILSSFKLIKKEFYKLAKNMEDISKRILEKKESGINKIVETFLNQKYSKKGETQKSKQDLNNKLKSLEKKKQEYKKVIATVEILRAEYMEEQGNIFADKEELERDCTDELRTFFKSYIKNFNEFFKNFKFPEQDITTIENMSGTKDTESFAERNKSLVTGPKINIYKEYAIDLNFYTENFEIIKSKLKGKSPKEAREFQHQISTEINNLLSDLIKEEKDEIVHRIEEIAKDLKDNRLSKKDYNYLIDKFQEEYDAFMKWKKEKVGNQEYRKVGKEWDERFIYMHAFMGYFNKKRVETKELNEENYNYLSDAMKKILDLNENEDIDYSLCDLIVILASTFYMIDPKEESRKKYVNEMIRDSSIMQKQGFWVGLTRYSLNEEILKQNKIEDTLKENDISEEKLNNSVIAKLMSISFSIMNYVLDSDLFNRIIFDIFKYCKINDENKEAVITMLENQINLEKLDYLKIDKEMLLSKPTEQ